MPRLCTCLFALAVASAGCASTQSIKYGLDQINAARAAPLPATLDVEVLADQRSGVPENGILFANDRDPTLDGKKLCINAEKHYEAGAVARQVSEAIRAHLEKRGSFERVVLGTATEAKYQLTGTLRSLYGSQEQSTSAKVGSMFGLIGALATAGAKTPGTIRIELVELALVGKNGSVVAKLPDVTETFQGEMQADAYCWAIYSTVNEGLRRAVERLAEQVEREVERTAMPAG